MNKEEIKKQYANGSVNADEVIKHLIEKFKIDKTSVDIQQLQLMAEYLIYKVDKLQKDNYKLDRESQHYFDRIQDLQKENEKLKEKLKSKKKQIKEMQSMDLPSEIEKNYVKREEYEELLEDNRVLNYLAHWNNQKMTNPYAAVDYTDTSYFIKKDEVVKIVNKFVEELGNLLND